MAEGQGLIQPFTYFICTKQRFPKTNALNNVTKGNITCFVLAVSIMASLPKRSRPHRIRHRLETECETESEKEALGRRLDRVRQLLTPPGARTIDISTLLNAMCA